jgi:hypothetical protein
VAITLFIVYRRKDRAWPTSEPRSSRHEHPLTVTSQTRSEFLARNPQESAAQVLSSNLAVKRGVISKASTASCVKQQSAKLAVCRTGSMDSGSMDSERALESPPDQGIGGPNLTATARTLGGSPS